MSTNLRDYVQRSVQLSEEIQSLQRKGARYSAGDDRSWQPSFEVYQHQEHLFIDIELPGVPASLVEVEVREGMIVVKGTKPSVNDAAQRDDLFSTRQFGPFSSRFAPPAGRVVTDLEQRLENGVLHLKVRVAPARALPEGR